MSGDITLSEEQKWALYFAQILKSRGFHEAAKSLEDTFNPIGPLDEECNPKKWPYLFKGSNSWEDDASEK